MEGLEPPRREAQVPKTCVSTNSTTWANGAGTKIRTRDLLITNQLLYQLSYASIILLILLLQSLLLFRYLMVFLFEN